jgi:hypothetical protein
MQQNDLCQRCFEQHTAPIWKPVYIYHDFDATGQEFDPICTDNYDLAGFELHCDDCKRQLELQAISEADDLPF